jgi:hypothetical protein
MNRHSVHLRVPDSIYKSNSGSLKLISMNGLFSGGREEDDNRGGGGANTFKESEL